MTLDGTNTWVLRAPGAESGLVVDPGPLDEGHLAAIAALSPYRFILITHGHHDHVEGAARLSELLGGTPVLAADPRHGGSFGEVREADGLRVDVVNTPGHTSDSVCFLAEFG